MARSTHTASSPTDALPRSLQSPAHAVARRADLVQRLRTAGHRRCDAVFQRRVDSTLAEANAALAVGGTARGGTEGLETTLRALDALTFELCED